MPVPKLIMKHFKNFVFTKRLICIIISTSIVITSLSFYLIDLRRSVYANIISSQLTSLLPAISPKITDQTLNFPLIKGISFSQDAPFKLDFYFDTMNKNKVSQKEMRRLTNYFLGFLTIPKEKLWVNLSPYEKEKVIPESLAKLDIGKGMLIEDYILKQLTSSLTDPKTPQGKKFWQQIRKISYQLAKTTELPIDTFNKIWIVPDIAEIYEHSVGAGSKPALNKQNKTIVFVKEAKLKVMIEEDYHNNVMQPGKGLISPVPDRHNLMIQETTSVKIQDPAPYNFEFSGVPLDNRNNKVRKINNEAEEIFKRELLPIIEKQVNNSEMFAPLRQMYYAFILAAYFKNKFKTNLFYTHYLNQEKTSVLDLNNPKVKEIVYQSYVKQFKQGVYNSINDEYDPYLSKRVKRTYFSGGMVWNKDPKVFRVNSLPTLDVVGKLFQLPTQVKPKLRTNASTEFSSLPIQNFSSVPMGSFISALISKLSESFSGEQEIKGEFEGESIVARVNKEEISYKGKNYNFVSVIVAKEEYSTQPFAYCVLYPDTKGETHFKYAIRKDVTGTFGNLTLAKDNQDLFVDQIKEINLFKSPGVDCKNIQFHPQSAQLLSCYDLAFEYQSLVEKGMSNFEAFKEVYKKAKPRLLAEDNLVKIEKARDKETSKTGRLAGLLQRDFKISSVVFISAAVEFEEKVDKEDIGKLVRAQGDIDQIVKMAKEMYRKLKESNEKDPIGLTANGIETYLRFAQNEIEARFINSVIRLFLLAGDDQLEKKLVKTVSEEGKLDINGVINIARELAKKVSKEKDAIGLVANGIQTYLKFARDEIDARFISSVIRMFLLVGDDQLEKKLVKTVSEEGKLDINGVINIARELAKKVSKEKDAIGLVANGIQTYLSFARDEIEARFISSVVRMFLLAGDENLGQNLAATVNERTLNIDEILKLAQDVYSKVKGSNEKDPIGLTANGIENYFIGRMVSTDFAQLGKSIRFLLHWQEKDGVNVLEQIGQNKGSVDELMNSLVPKLSLPESESEDKKTIIQEVIDYVQREQGKNKQIQETSSASTKFSSLPPISLGLSKALQRLPALSLKKGGIEFDDQVLIVKSSSSITQSEKELNRYLQAVYGKNVDLSQLEGVELEFGKLEPVSF